MLRSLANTPLHLKSLSHLQLSDPVHDILNFYHIFEREVIRVTSIRNLEHLSIPALARSRASELERRVGSLDVTM